jgi:hypothetical protein
MHASFFAQLPQIPGCLEHVASKCVIDSRLMTTAFSLLTIHGRVLPSLEDSRC